MGNGMVEDTGEQSLNRRAVLKNVAAGASVVGFSGISAAHTDSATPSELERSFEMKRAAEPFTDRDAVQRALSDHAEEVRERLAAEGISLSLSYDGFDEVRSFPDSEDGVATAHIVAEQEDDTRRIELHVLPQADRTFAFVDKGSDASRLKVEGNSVEPMVYCETSTYCDGYCQCSATQPCGNDCEAGYEVTEECCTYSDGSTSCEIKDRTCTYDCPGNDECD